MPAKKARCFEVTCRNGHGEYTKIIPGQSKDDIKNKLDVPSNDKLVSIKHIGHRIFAAMPDEEMDCVKFEGDVDGRLVEVFAGDQGHIYLCQQFPSQVKSVKDFIRTDYGRDNEF